MTEAEVVAQAAFHGDRIWSVTQYWTSVCFGLLIAAHFVAARIHWLALAAFLFIYVLFSMHCADMLMFDTAVIRAALESLEQIKQLEELGPLGEAFLAEAPVSTPGVFKQVQTMGLFLGMFCVCIGYPVYCHRRGD